MPGPKAPPIRLTPKQRRKLERFVSSRKAESGLVERIRIVLMAAGGTTNAEIWFAILARRVLKHGSFRTGHELEAAVIGFVRYWNRYEAHPFRWTFRGRFKRAA